MKKILIVEDEALISLDLKNRLERQGYQVLPIATSASKAVETAVQERPDIILVDVVLKGAQDGIEAACAIVQEYRVPILFITGHARFLDDERLGKIPVYRILGKPHNKTVLMEAIEKLLEEV
jgi:two-component system, response regulator PdtaR